jgi:hypothetical protein
VADPELLKAFVGALPGALGVIVVVLDEGVQKLDVVLLNLAPAERALALVGPAREEARAVEQCLLPGGVGARHGLVLLGAQVLAGLALDGPVAEEVQ